jgi:sugar phosphate isomerase/epimerase
MAKISLGINLEFVRHDDKPFEWGVEKAAELGYRYVEPMVHWGRELLSEAGYFHSVSMFDDPLRIRRACEKAGVKLSGLSSHTPLCKPEISVEYLKQAVRFAAECGAPIVNTDEGPKPTWTSVEEDHVLMRYVLHEAAAMAEPRGILIGLEMHQQYSKTIAGLDRICDLVDSPAIGINFDTGNSLLGGEDPIAWLEHCQDRLIHLHAKDISIEQSAAERGKVTGTPVGCACGDGVIDWAKVIEVCDGVEREEVVFSVECGTVEQAERSIKYLEPLLESVGVG